VFSFILGILFGAALMWSFKNKDEQEEDGDTTKPGSYKNPFWKKSDDD
jgi:hypothetical protein